MSLHGDITGDGKIGRDDLELLKRLVHQLDGNPELVDTLTPELLARLDINGDGQIDEDDVDALCQLLLKGDRNKCRELVSRFRDAQK